MVQVKTKQTKSSNHRQNKKYSQKEGNNYRGVVLLVTILADVALTRLDEVGYCPTTRAIGRSSPKGEEGGLGRSSKELAIG